MSQMMWKMCRAYTAYNLNHFVIYLPRVIKIDGNSTKFCQKQFCTVFSETRCLYNVRLRMHKNNREKKDTTDSNELKE